MTLVLLLALAITPDSAKPLQVLPLKEPTRAKVVARLAKRDLSSLPTKPDQQSGESRLTLRLLGEDGKPGPAIFGTYRHETDSLVFFPRHRLVHGRTYRATLVLTSAKSITVDYRVAPRKPSPRAVVASVYPSGSRLPANHLKFYITFSRPMREGRATFDHLHILDDQGTEVPDPWRRTELWSPDARRLTLWIHPGRVKKGLLLREQQGPVLKPDRKYTLLIDAEMLDAVGQPIEQPFRKEFQTSIADHHRPLPQDWKLTSPRAGTREPVRLEFGEPLDHALLLRFLDVRNADKERVVGKITVGPGETSWEFRPQHAWNTNNDSYSITIEDTLEDLAGNTPLRVFDRDLKQSEGERPRLSLPFRPSGTAVQPSQNEME